jgi:hypothetical protein
MNAFRSHQYHLIFMQTFKYLDVITESLNLFILLFVHLNLCPRIKCVDPLEAP